jgi:hypothetical protein
MRALVGVGVDSRRPTATLDGPLLVARANST